MFPLPGMPVDPRGASGRKTAWDPRHERSENAAVRTSPRMRKDMGAMERCRQSWHVRMAQRKYPIRPYRNDAAGRIGTDDLESERHDRKSMSRNKIKRDALGRFRSKIEIEAIRRNSVRIKSTLPKVEWSIHRIIRQNLSRPVLATRGEMANPITRFTVVRRILQRSYAERYPLGIPANLIRMDLVAAEAFMKSHGLITQSPAPRPVHLSLRWLQETPFLFGVRSGGRSEALSVLPTELAAQKSTAAFPGRSGAEMIK